MRTALPRRARFTTDEALIEFTRRAGGPKTLEDCNIFDMMIRRGFGEITLEVDRGTICQAHAALRNGRLVDDVNL
jgi:hypothetical protein